MSKRKWYVDPEDGIINEDNIWHDKRIQNYIDLYCDEDFKKVDDLTLQNLPIFLEIILNRYREYYFNSIDLKDLGEAVLSYIHYADLNEFPYRESPDLPKTDRRALVIDILCILDDNSLRLQEDALVLINYLHTPDEQLVGAYDRLEAYFAQFDIEARWKEIDKRWEAITQQRIEAIANQKPLPIKPMGIELDTCYKK